MITQGCLNSSFISGLDLTFEPTPVLRRLNEEIEELAP